MSDHERDHGFEAPATAKEVVIYNGGWGFRLPNQHRALLSADMTLVSLSIPDRGAIYYLDRIEETEEEFRIHVRGEKHSGHAMGAQPMEYPFPAIQDELKRLTRDYNELRGAHSADAPVGWAQGASHDSHTAWLRSEIRRMRQEGG